MEKDVKDLQYPVGKVVLPEGPLTDAERAALIEEVAALPARLTAAARRVGGQGLQRSYRPGGWTGRQVVHHVADVHLNFYMRFHLALADDNPSVPLFKPDAWAALPDVEATPVTVSLTLVEALHARLTLLLWALSEEQWLRTFFHPAHNRTYTLYQALAQLAWHGRHHLAHVESIGETKGT